MIHKSTDFTPVFDDIYVVDTTAGNIIITLPDATSGRKNNGFLFLNIGANQITINAPEGQTINGSASLINNVQWKANTILSDRANYYSV